MEDGSTDPCRSVAEAYAPVLDIKYFFKENEGRSIARNYGMGHATGDYFIFFDSDCVIPADYFEKLNRMEVETPADCFGGPDAADASFTTTQKAINHAMTSFLTTGGIRGGKISLEKFTPRTFNMGFSRQVYQSVGGFREMFSEDIDMSTRIRKAGFSIALYPDLPVYHKRRVDFRKFLRQVYVFGMSRITLKLLYPDSLKAVHCLPAVFVVGVAAMILLAIVWSPWWLLPPRRLSARHLHQRAGVNPFGGDCLQGCAGIAHPARRLRVRFPQGMVRQDRMPPWPQRSRRDSPPQRQIIPTRFTFIIKFGNMQSDSKSILIRNLNDDERPREKAMTHGMDALTDVELLALLLGSGLPGKSVLDLSREILADVDNRLSVLARMSIAELKKKYRGVGDAKATLLVAAMTFGSRVQKSMAVPFPQICCSTDAYNYMRDKLERLNYEEFWVLHLTRANRVQFAERVSKGELQALPSTSKSLPKAPSTTSPPA